jgi:hypothetical protein
MILVKMKLIPSLEMGRKTYQQTRGLANTPNNPSPKNLDEGQIKIG